MKVYICGNLENPQAFEHAEAFLRMHGHIPINPVKILYALPAEINNSDFTVIAFEIIRICDAVYPISGWDKDLLARVEMSYAKRNDKEIFRRNPNQLITADMEAATNITEVPDVKEKYPLSKFQYHGKSYRLYLKVNTYPDGNLVIKLYLGNSDFSDFWGSLTTNLSGIRPPDCAFINIQEYGNEILSWIEENKLAEPTGQLWQADGIEYPEYCFFPERLLELDEAGYTYYSRCQKGTLGRRYERLYIALKVLKKGSDTFHYTDYSGWRHQENSSDSLSLWIEAEDTALQRRCTIIHKGVMMKLTVRSLDEHGNELPETAQNIYCRIKEELSQHMLSLFQIKPSANAIE